MAQEKNMTLQRAREVCTVYGRVLQEPEPQPEPEEPEPKSEPELYAEPVPVLEPELEPMP